MPGEGEAQQHDKTKVSAEIEEVKESNLEETVPNESRPDKQDEKKEMKKNEVSGEQIYIVAGEVGFTNLRGRGGRGCGDCRGCGVKGAEDKSHSQGLRDREGAKQRRVSC